MKKNMKKLALLLATVSVLGVTACGSNEAAETESNNTPAATEAVVEAGTEDAAEAEVSAVKTMAGAELQAIVDDKEAKEGVLIIDVRSEEEYKAGHVKFAINMPIDTFEENIASIEDWKDAPVITVCNSGNKSGQVADILVANGFTDVTNADGVKVYEYNLVTWSSIRGAELQAIADEGETLIIDNREQEDYEAGHFATAIWANSEDMEAVADQLPADKDTKIVTHCYSGNRCAVAGQWLVDNGYTNVYVSNDGTKEMEFTFAE